MEFDRPLAWHIWHSAPGVPAPYAFIAAASCEVMGMPISGSVPPVAVDVGVVVVAGGMVVAVVGGLVVVVGGGAEVVALVVALAPPQAPASMLSASVTLKTNHNPFFIILSLNEGKSFHSV